LTSGELGGVDQGVFSEFADMALTGSGQHIPPQKSYLVEARLSHIIRREGFSMPGELAACLVARPNPVLSAEVPAALTAKPPHFFRSRAALKHVVDVALPALVEAGRKKLRIWCAGGATGQEAYSLAMLLEETDTEALKDIQIDIVSTDLCAHVTERARTGHYGHFEVQRGLSIHRLLDNFTRQEDGGWQLSEDLRRKVSFRQHNLLEDMSGLGAFDVILCRDVLPGMVKPVREQVTQGLINQLSPTGHLVLGEGEPLALLADTVAPVEDMRYIFVKRDTGSAAEAA